MKRLLFASFFACASLASAAELLRVTASHDLSIARPSETIAIPWTEVQKALPGALIQHIAVKDSKGHVLAHQVTNVAPLSKDPQNIGVAYGELLFQHSFTAGEKSAAFTVEKIEALAPPFPVKAFGRYVQERLDDFAWENDRVAHRIYGSALGAPALPGSGKEVLMSSGIDIWFKRVDYPIVDRWYNKGHDHYHHDEGEGMDFYSVGVSRGAGGTGIWDGKLFVSNNYKSWKVIANGPVRTVFELSYDSWDAAGTQVSEVKRFTVDAGHQFDQIESTFTFSGKPQLKAAVGLAKQPLDKKVTPEIDYFRDLNDNSLVQWVSKAPNGEFGTALIVPDASGYGEDELNQLMLASVTSGKPLRYLAGAAWTRAGHITSAQQWKAEVAREALTARHPLTIKTSN